jgi:two-component system sensor histidine kinase PilS (NtrC family)
MEKFPLSLNTLKKPVPETDLWQALLLFNVYRFILAFSFWMTTQFDIEKNVFYITNPSLYNAVSLFYFLASIVFLIIPFLVKHHYYLQINVSIFFDVPAIIMLMHACGGMSSAIGLLLIVLVAAHSLLVSERWALFSAAFATLGLISEQVYNIIYYTLPLTVLLQVGLLGSVLLISAYMINTLSIRIRINQKALTEHAEALLFTQKLNSQIVATMQEGIIVFDKELNIQNINSAAYKLLNFHPDHEINSLKYLPKNFQQAFNVWKKTKREIHAGSIRLNFHSLGKDITSSILVFIYDTTQEVKRAQELKLASLGHLTANIAHELRNPLAAVSHAAQLLGESSDLGVQDRDFVRIIREHAARMNTVIQNVLSISSRKEARIERFDLISWLENFAKSLVISNLPQAEITFDHPNQSFFVSADPTQLSQILINLSENGLRYSFRYTGRATLTFRVREQSDRDVIILDVIDQGIGVAKPIVKHIFEPFFTTEKLGSGLGLFLAKELCNINNIHIDHIQPPESGSIFRLSFPMNGNMR